MTEQDKQALIKHFCERDCGEAAKGCTIMPCHEIELIQEFPTSEADSDTISRTKAIAEVAEALRGLPVVCKDIAKEAIEQLPPAKPKRGKWIKISPANIYECSECGKSVMTNDICAYDFCHGCGAEMEVTT